MGKLGAYLRFLCGLRGFLNTPITYPQATETLARRLAGREDSFLRLAKRCVYGNPSSPYLPLLKRAGCGYGDMADGVRRLGLEGLLRQLRDAGVWVSLDEFKGDQPICRGDLEAPVHSEDFRNPLVTAGFEVASGGTTRPSVRTPLDLDYLTERSAYEHLLFRMLEIHDVPVALWYPRLPAVTGVGNGLRYAKIGHPPSRWFCMLTDNEVRPGLESRLATAFIVWASRLTRFPLPHPERATLRQAQVVLDWIRVNLRRHGRCVLQSYVSQAVRLCHAAIQKSLNLSGTQFIVGSEALSPAKFREIDSVGAKVFPRYMTTEAGTIGMGCGKPHEVGEYHLCSDAVAMIQDQAGTGEPSPFHFTSLREVTPRVMINVQLGDSGVAASRRCGCLLEELGFTTHLWHVSSFQKATGEGMKVSARELVRIAEEVLPKRFGGSSLDYQWVEQEDVNSLTRLLLRADPSLGPISEKELVGVVLDEFRRAGAAGALTAQMWRQAETIRVLREPPRQTSTGKLVPLRPARANSPRGES